MAQPIGFDATWSYLQAKVERPWRDPEFLLPAIGLLEAERRIHLSMTEEFAVLRGEQKAAGRRIPPRRDVTPWNPPRWHGDERLGAVHSLGSWRRLYYDQVVAAHRNGKVVVAAVNRILEMEEEVTAAALDPGELQRILDWAHRQTHVTGWDGDRSEYNVAWVVRYLLGQLYLIAYGATPIATPWKFHATLGTSED
ncbi:MAG: hypothetical protein J2P25_04055 [Nocardiopsaceae bacterium]|nr:hypothetical protein [Nocardiopsaceae bacterium]